MLQSYCSLHGCRWIGATLGLAVLTLNLSAGRAPAGDGAEPGGPRNVVAGVWTTIEPHIQDNEQYSRHDLKKMLGLRPGIDLTSISFPPTRTFLRELDEVRFTHDVRALEFSFKPMRFISIDVPQPSGRLRQTNVWYLAYRVRNTGERPIRFVPRFVLQSHDTGKLYANRVIPLAMGPISRREDPNLPWKNSADIAGTLAPAADGESSQAWGVATWHDIDPKTDRLSVYVEGLTNSYRWYEPPGEPVRMLPKVLQLNFWRPGDEFEEHEDEIRYGVPSTAFRLTARDFVGLTAELTPSGESKLTQVAALLGPLLEATPVFPILILPNRFGIQDLDLDRGNAVAEHLVAQGVTRHLADVQTPTITEFRARESAYSLDPLAETEEGTRDDIWQANRSRSLPGHFWVYVRPGFLYND